MITSDAVSAPPLPHHRRVILQTHRSHDFAGALGSLCPPERRIGLRGVHPLKRRTVAAP